MKRIIRRLIRVIADESLESGDVEMKRKRMKVKLRNREVYKLFALLEYSCEGQSITYSKE